ncbi:hypothetical protein A1O1_01002 [Capronia coronata CBS 617.96]|uniref:Amidase domain-containing protein n=1 Tax=Capronia coronata CBS 617.96 TaxID=1182541 RepID=W9YSM9_9EURO|nr:uncharacterized protein A1O1_01002 [Capronia coronata CBS 617.96]EXJ95877.1 hypothetical protein A1O1_01002 [Capronia coronata CBS 617.96]
MVVVALENATKLEAAEVQSLAQGAGISLPDKDIDDWCVLLGSFEDSAQSVLKEDDCLPIPDPKVYTRTDIYVPEDNNKGGWATRCTVKSTAPTSDRLGGCTVAVKDNTAVAGVRCLNGLPPVDGEWIPAYDATIITRVLDAGGIIAGKAACENACMECLSNTSYTGAILNPYSDNHGCGGSSSGSARLVAVGAVDMALGGDQGGSIRIPSAFCGIVGLKPTFGLVPYTGILGHQSTFDHAGPMTKNVRDNALLLEVIAGPDGRDDRQPAYLPPQSLRFSSALDDFLASKPKDQLLQGFKIGVLKEGFDSKEMDPNIANANYSAIEDLKALGAEIVEVSVPSHIRHITTWMCSLPLIGCRQGILGDTTGRKQLEMTDRGVTAAPAMGPSASARLSQKAFDSFGPGGQSLYLRYLYVQEKYGASLHAKCTNLLYKATQEYDAVLATVDVLVMPTVPMPALSIAPFAGAPVAGPLETISYPIGIVNNTAQFDATGHPALSIPVGFVPAADDPAVKLPAGLQIVGKRFEDLTCFKVGAAWEQSKDWKTLVFEN